MKFIALLLVPLLLQDSRKPAAVSIEGFTAVPPAVFERLQQYQNMRGAGFQDWAVDGKSILISTRFGNTSQLHRVHAPGGRREQITFFDEPVSEGKYLPDGSILFTQSAGGNENFQIFRLDLATGRAALLTDGKSRYLLGAPNSTDSRFVIGINKPKERNTDLFLFDPAKPAAPELLLDTKGDSWHGIDWSPDDSKLLLMKYVSANESYLHVMDVATRALTPIPVPGNVKASHDAVAFSADGTSVYLASDATGEFTTLAKVNLATMEYTWITSDIPWNVTSIEMTKDRSKIAFTVNEDGASRLYLIDEGGKPRKVGLPLGIVSDLSFSPDGKRLALTLNRPEAPGDVYTLDGDALTRWTFSETGGLNPATFVVPERISVESFDKQKIPAYVYRPRDTSKKAPVILTIHGGPEGQYQPYFSSITQFQAVEMGCAVIGPNVRGSSGYGKTFLALDNADKREDSVKDIGAILDWIAKQPDLDASRVAVTGGSYGGYMVLACLIHHGARLKAGIDVVGIANFTTFLSNTSAYRQDLRRVEYGDERDPKMKEYFEMISPSNHAGKITSALMVAHGKNDPRVPFSEAQLIAKKVKEAGTPVWTVYADNEGHGFGKKENRDYLSAASVHFFNEFLLK